MRTLLLALPVVLGCTSTVGRIVVSAEPQSSGALIVERCNLESGLFTGTTMTLCSKEVVGVAAPLQLPEHKSVLEVPKP